MKKRILIATALFVMLICLFLFGPAIGKSLYFRLTPEKDLQAWKRDFMVLDNAFPRTISNENRRVDIARKLARRGINLDNGIRDEAIEHNINPYTIFVMTCWSWEELLGFQ